MRDATTPLTKAEARRLTDEVRADLQSLRVKICELYLGRAERALGYASWGEYEKAELADVGLKLPPEKRRGQVAYLDGLGYPVRAIAAAVGASKSTVANDLQRPDLDTQDHEADYQRDIDAAGMAEVFDVLRKVLADIPDSEIVEAPLPLDDEPIVRAIQWRNSREGGGLFGCFTTPSRVITLYSRVFRDFRDAEDAARSIVGTFLHEVAHALLPPASAHGPTWKHQARSLGLTGERCRDDGSNHDLTEDGLTRWRWAIEAVRDALPHSEYPPRSDLLRLALRDTRGTPLSDDERKVIEQAIDR